MSEELPEPAIEQPDETPIMTSSAPDQDEVKKKNKKEFWLGVGLWFLLNWLVMPIIGGVIFFVMAAITSGSDYNSPLQTLSGLMTIILNFIPFLVNVGLMTYFVVVKRQQVALGMLTGFGFALVIVVCLGALFMAACFGMLASYSA